MTTATVITSPNLACNKYWGKKPGAPKNSALHNNVCVVLGGLTTKTTVRVKENAEKDSFVINGKPVSEKDYKRHEGFVNYLRAELGFGGKIELISQNGYPTNFGLASSAAGYAAETLAVARAVGAELPESRLSALARNGSGSACRSVPFAGGFNEWITDEGYARTLVPPEYWPDFRIVVGVARGEEKPISSQEAMDRSINSPMYEEWLENGNADFLQIRDAVHERDIESLGQAAERNARRMHALIRTTGVGYWNPESWTMSAGIERARVGGLAAWWTSDAGPHIKAFCLEPDVGAVEDVLMKNGALRTIKSYPGLGPKYTEDHLPSVVA